MQGPVMIGAGTRLVSLLGNPVGHSLSPIMHNAAYGEAGLDLCYMAFRVNPGDLGKALEGLKSLGALGTNITVPFKERALLYMDRLAPEADAVGAVNTVVFKKSGTWGYNTDIAGIAQSLGLLPRCGGTAFLLGAGGAARAAAYTLGHEGYDSIWISNRNIRRAERIAEDLADVCGIPLKGVVPWGEVPEEPCGLVVNATSLGLEGKEWPGGMAERILTGTGAGALLDLVYRPGERTPLVEKAESMGLAAIGGEEVLLRQGAAAFELFAGVDAPMERMRQSLHNKRPRTGEGKGTP